MTLSVLTLNLWHDSGPWPARAERIRGWIDRLSPDLIAFQEALRVPKLDQPAALLGERPYHVAFAPASPFWRVGRESERGVLGNAIASRFPIDSQESIVLPDAGDRETRSALSVTVLAPPGPVSFTATHLNWKLHHGWVREQQVVALCDFVRRRQPKQGFPPILAGDLNAEPESSEIRYLTGHQSIGGWSVAYLDCWRVAGGPGPGLTWSNANPWARAEREPARRIDYIFAGLPRRDGLGEVLDCRVVCDDEVDGVWPSDHFGVYAELRSEPDAGAAGGA
jgi:endonuclease/exonuclease/phosphatase family metal-dependent hydrolase